MSGAHWTYAPGVFAGRVGLGGSRLTRPGRYV